MCFLLKGIACGVIEIFLRAGSSQFFQSNPVSQSGFQCFSNALFMIIGLCPVCFFSLLIIIGTFVFC